MMLEEVRRVLGCRARMMSIGVLLVVVFVFPFVTGCVGHPCSDSRTCGASGNLLSSDNGDIFELSESEQFVFFAAAPGGSHPRGIAFGAGTNGLRLYAAATDGLRVYEGRRDWWAPARLQQTIPIENCEDMADVATLSTGRVVLACTESGRLISVHPDNPEQQQEFECCDEQDGFHPVAITVSPADTVLAGQDRVLAFDGKTGKFVRVAVPAGVLGAEGYEDFLFDGSGNLLVSASSSVGVLRFDAQTFEFKDLLVDANTDVLGNPGTLVVNQAGRLVINQQHSGHLVEFELDTGAFHHIFAEDRDGGSAVRLRFMAVRP